MSTREYLKLTVNLLKEELKKRSLDQSGKKADLIARLENDDLLRANQGQGEVLNTNEDTNNTEEFNNESKDISEVDTESPDFKSTLNNSHNNNLGDNNVNNINTTNDTTATTLDQSTDNTYQSEQHLTSTTTNNSTNNNVSQVDTTSSSTSVVADVSMSDDKTSADNDATTTSVMNVSADGVTGSNNSHEKDRVESQTSGNTDTFTSSTTNEHTNMDTTDDITNSTNPSSADITGSNTNEANNDEDKCDNNEAEAGKAEGSTEAAGTEASSSTEVVDDKKRAEDDARVAGLFCIEMKREFDAFQLKWYGKKFTVPFLGEILADLAGEVAQRSFQASNLSREEIKAPVVMAMLDASTKFSIDFLSQILCPVTNGTVKMTFGTKEECEGMEKEMKEFKEDVVISKIKFDDQVNQQFLHKDSSKEPFKGSILERLLYVGNLPLEMDPTYLEDLKARFPQATKVIVPPVKEHNTARYVYFEYESVESLAEAAENHKLMVVGEDKLFVIKALCIRKERFGLLTDTLKEILLEKIRKMKRVQKNPYNKSKQELQEINKAISINLDKLSTDSKHRKGWGMELGALDETRLEKEDFGSSQNRISSSSGSSNRGPRGNRNSYDNRRSSGPGQRYGNYYGGGGYGGASSYGGNYGGSRPGWATSTQSPSYSSPYQLYGQHQGFGNYGQQTGQQNYYNSVNKRKSNDNYGSDWKRTRNI